MRELDFQKWLIEHNPKDEKHWKEHFWSQSFCLLTTGGALIEVIKNIFKVKVKNCE